MRVPNTGDNCWGPEVRSLRCTSAIIILTSASWRLTSVSRNEGASGDVHENKGAGKSARAKYRGQLLGARGPKPATHKRDTNSDFCLLTADFCFKK